MCHFYNPHTAASHDAFIFHTPVPQGVIDALEGQRINEMGAENRVLSILRLHAGVRDVVNPCERIHAFHLHCGMERAPSALGRGREGHGVREWGFVTGWMGKHERAFGEVDCLAFGGMLET